MYKVLIVDDEMIVRHAVKSLIRWEGSRFEYAGSAASGTAALEMVNREEPDIVITDIKMSEMDGLELIKRLMKQGFSGEILVLSNYNDFELVREALRCGAHDYMLKLTLKSDHFMTTLEEIALKLDQKKTALIRTSLLKDSGQRNVKSIVQEWIRRIDSGNGAQVEQEGKAALLEVFAGQESLYAFTFAIHVLSYAAHENEGSQYQETLTLIAEGLFPGNYGIYVVSTDHDRYLLLIMSPVTRSHSGVPNAEELAQRIKGLSNSYYNVDICVIYGEAVSSYEEIAQQVRLNRAAAPLIFYTKYQEQGLRNSIAERSEADSIFQQSEKQLKDSLRHSGGPEIDLWLESALVLIRTAAELHISPRSVKRAIIGGVWGIAGSSSSLRESSWNEGKWIQQIEASLTDSQLMLLVQDMYDEVMGTIVRTVGLKYMREEIRQANAYLEQHFAGRVFISEVAAFVGFSEPYLCQVFKAETGTSILTRLNEIRMLKAHELLSSGNYLIKQVAMEVGIPDPFYFNRLFKKRFGVAPKTVKNLQGEKMEDFKKEL